MPSTMNGSELLVVVFTLIFGTQVFAEAACSPRSYSNVCSQVITPVTHSTNQEVAQAKAGSCDFKHKTCDYKQGCRQDGAPKWTHNSTKGYFQMKAIQPGNFGKFSVLESPFLNISTTSCLRFTASFQRPVKLGVLLSGFNRNCTVFQNRSRLRTRPESLQLPPIGPAKVLFQGFGGGDTNHSLLLYNVTVDVGCCQDPVWPNGKNNVLNSPNRPYCNWSVSNWVINSSYVAVIDTNARDGTLTTPLIRATSSGATDCLKFDYFLSDDDGNSLTVCIMDMQNVFRPLWTVSNKNNTRTGQFVYLKGQIPVPSSVAFKLRFTGRRNEQNAIVAIQKVRYQRRKESDATCTTEPPEAVPPANHNCNISGGESGANAGGIAAGVIIALLVIIAIVIGVVILWRRRNRAKSGAGPGASTPIEDMMNDGRQRSAHQYARTESVAPLAMHEDQSESTSYYSVIKDVPSAQKTAGSENDGYAVAKDVAPQGGVKKGDDTTNPYDTADSDTDGTTNPAFVDDYNHIGAGARNKNAASSDGKRDDYNHVNTHCARASKTNRNADGPLRSNEYHELERVDSDATPHTSNTDGEHTPHDEYNRLGNIKGGNPAATEGRGATPRAYDHVGLTETEGDPYDLARQDKRNNRVDPDYNRLGDI